MAFGFCFFVGFWWLLAFGFCFFVGLWWLLLAFGFWWLLAFVSLLAFVWLLLGIFVGYVFFGVGYFFLFRALQGRKDGGKEGRTDGRKEGRREERKEGRPALLSKKAAKAEEQNKYRPSITSRCCTGFDFDCGLLQRDEVCSLSCWFARQPQFFCSIVVLCDEVGAKDPCGSCACIPHVFHDPNHFQ